MNDLEARKKRLESYEPDDDQWLMIGFVAFGIIWSVLAIIGVGTVVRWFL